MDEERVLLVTTRETGEDERRVYLREVEIRSLIETLGLCVVFQKSFTVKEESRSSFFGRGQIDEIREIARGADATEVIVDAFLSPKQEMRIEEEVGLPVSDREAVILSIFRINAHSKEARLQTLKATAVYQKPRLIFREANYSQQRGGVRGAKGEGEKEIELQRRTIERQITALDREIREIRKIRETQHKRREKNSVFSFALTGYTNSGKTTILSSLTKNAPPPENRLFATLDTTSRLLTLPSGREAILSDTVGFIRNLPPSLIEAFSSTLEEALSADAVIIVADASHPDAAECFRTTLDTISSLGAEERIRLVVINKIESRYDDISLSFLRSSGYRTVETSFTENIGREELLKALDDIVNENYTTLRLLLPYSSPLFSSLSSQNKVKSADYREDGILVEAVVPVSERERYTPFIHN
jgi:GTPase